MRNSRRSFSNSNNRSGGSNFRSRNSGGRNFSSGGGSSFGNRNRGGGNRGRGGRRGFNQATFDPTRMIIQAGLKTPEDVVEKAIYEPTNTFNDFDISDKLKENIAKRGYQNPTPIQDQIIPYIIEGRDVVGIANTGTGKTAAFLIPLLDKVMTSDHEQVLIIAPTRELALQVRDELRSFSDGMRVFSTLCIGGSSINRQIESLRRGQQFVIGTPGRIKDLNQRGKLNFNQFTNIVLDEVDRMLDMGFVHEIRAIIDALPQDRKSLFFSATMTDRVRQIMNGFLTNPITVSVKTQDTSANVRQEIVKIKGRSKVDVLEGLLNTDNFEKVLVFGRTKHGTEKLSKELQNRGFRVNAIHGNKSQGQRQRALKQFRNDKVQALIATDVIARGLDINDVTHVINYDLPESKEDYIHRIGRTGRADKVGVALTFIE